MFLFNLKRQLKDKSGWIIFGVIASAIIIFFTILSVLENFNIVKVPTILIVLFLCFYNLSGVIKFYKIDKKSSLMNMEIRNNKSIWKIFYIRVLVIKTFTFLFLILFLIMSLFFSLINEVMVDHYYIFFWKNYWSLFLVDISVFCFFVFIAQFCTTVWTAVSSVIITLLITLSGMFTMIFSLLTREGEKTSEIPTQDYRLDFYKNLQEDKEIYEFASLWKESFDNYKSDWITPPSENYEVYDCKRSSNNKMERGAVTADEAIGYIYFYSTTDSECKIISEKYKELENNYNESIKNNTMYDDFNNFYFYLQQSLILPLRDQYEKVFPSNYITKNNFYIFNDMLEQLKGSEKKLIPYINPMTSNSQSLSEKAIYKIAKYAFDFYFTLKEFENYQDDEFKLIYWDTYNKNRFIEYISFTVYHYFFKYLFQDKNLKELGFISNFQKKLEAFSFSPFLLYDKLTTFISVSDYKNKYVDYIFINSGFGWYREIKNNTNYDKTKDLNSKKYIIEKRKLTYNPAGPILTVLILTFTTIGLAYLIYWRRVRV